ncbi:MAG: VOC family protein [Reinekea sp.]|jgi:methylmalonyl-CoA/ethylmalonyl-CoA epimerase
MSAFKEVTEIREVTEVNIIRDSVTDKITENKKETHERRVERHEIKQALPGQKWLAEFHAIPHPFIRGVSHINIGVPDLERAIDFYSQLLAVEPLQAFDHFRNTGFARSAGFLDNPEEVEVSIAFVAVPGTQLTLELMQYHMPVAVDKVRPMAVNDVGGVRHIALKVENIDAAFAHVKSIPGIRLINPARDYQPFRIDPITVEEFRFFDLAQETDRKQKEDVCNIVAAIRYFYFIDPYGVQWEFEQGHSDL